MPTRANYPAYKLILIIFIYTLKTLNRTLNTCESLNNLGNGLIYPFLPALITLLIF